MRRAAPARHIDGQLLWGASRWWIPVAMLLAVAVAVRWSQWGLESADFTNYVHPWFQTLDREGARAFGREFSDYAPAYLYFVWLATLVPLQDLASIKGISLAFDVLLAAAGGALLAGMGLPLKRAAVGAAILFSAPTVVLNGAAWAQCDSIYTSFIVAGLASLVWRRGWLAALCFGAALAFKGQAAFVLPGLLALTLRGRFEWRMWWLLPVPYTGSIVLPALMGRPLPDLLSIYLNQAGQYTGLTLNAPTLYAWLPFEHASLGRLGIVSAAMVVALGTAAVVRWAPLKSKMDEVAVVALSAVAVPFLLPRMHDRYFFVADVLTIVIAVASPRRWWLALLVNAASLACYGPFLYGRTFAPLWLAAAVMAVALAGLVLVVFGYRRFPLPRRTWRVSGQLVRFAAVGLASTALFALIYAALRSQAGPVWANGLALALTMGFNFAANRLWSFRSLRWSVRDEALGYGVSYLAGLVSSTVALRLALAVLGEDALGEAMAVAAASVCATATRYLLLTRFVYVGPRARPGRSVFSHPARPPGSLSPDVRPPDGDAPAAPVRS
jgi:Gpi18-like mannosyltransferase/putative flippase GtrA